MRLNCTIFFILLISFNNAFSQQILRLDKNPKAQKNVIKKNLNNLSSQPLRPTVGRQKCGFASMLKKATAKGYNQALYEGELKKLIQKRIATGQTAFTGIVTIPIVFHCIFRTGDVLSATSPNLSNTMFQAQLDQLNKDYANLSGSSIGVATDIRIRFCLAVVDTTGKLLAEPGIDRINGSTRGWSITDDLTDVELQSEFDGIIKPASIWDPYSYFNVWTAPMTSSGLLGYATFPSLSTLPGLDNTEDNTTAGVVIAWESVGSTSVPGLDADFGYGRTLTHESGHFFGLRHIWGDDLCGDDYCNDTPPQDDASVGCPSDGALNNCTPSGPKMFQNYMDYTDDACVNTFTSNQAIRCQTAMDNSPRRLSLLSSKVCQTRAANTVQFASATPYAVLETGNPGSCPNTKSYSFNIYVANKASGAATLTFSVTGGSALLNSDYTISPATISYTANDAAVKKVTITILDDQQVELTEGLQISYTISGTGVIAAPDKQILSIAIVDDDVALGTINNLTPTKNLLSENFNATTDIPVGWTTDLYDDGTGSYTPNQWVVSANGGIGTSGNAAHITRSTTLKSNTYTNTRVSDAYLISPLLDATGLSSLNLSFKWRCLGEVGYDEGYLGFIPEGMAANGANVIYFDTVFVDLAAGTTAVTTSLGLPLTNTKFRLVFNWYNDETDGANPPFTIDDVVLSGNFLSVASTVDADTTFSQFNGQAVSYYSTSTVAPYLERVIATVSNPNQQLGCVTASIQNAGTGKTALSTVSGSFFRTDKVIKISPSTANTTASYTGTLYFSTAELSNAWTALEIPALKILKVKEGINLSSVIAAADAQLITPSFTDKASSGYYSYSGNFTGFSQFMLVSPNSVLPVQLLNFDVVSKKNSILLNWFTSVELNNKGFKIERSINGVNFESIGWVNGKINSSVQSAYTFSDNFVQPNIVYFYRLRQVNLDNKEELSFVKQARLKNDIVTVSVSPVPAKDYINLFISGNNKPADIRLINLQGQLVKSWLKVSSFNSFYKLNTSGLPAGIYSLDIILPEEKQVKKIMIER